MQINKELFIIFFVFILIRLNPVEVKKITKRTIFGGLLEGYGAAFGYGGGAPNNGLFGVNLNNFASAAAGNAGQPYPVPVDRPIPIPVPQPYPVDRPFPVARPVPIPISRPYPVPVDRPIPVPIGIPFRRNNNNNPFGLPLILRRTVYGNW